MAMMLGATASPSVATQPVARSTGGDAAPTSSTGLGAILAALQPAPQPPALSGVGLPPVAPPAMPGAPAAAATNPMAAAAGLLNNGVGVLGNGNVNPLQQFMLRQMAANQPGGAGTPAQQAQAGMGQLGAPGGAPQGGIGAMSGGLSVPGTAEQSPFFNATNAQNAQAAVNKTSAPAGGLGGMTLSGAEGDVSQAVNAAIGQFGGSGTYGAFNNDVTQQLSQLGFTPQMIAAITPALTRAAGGNLNGQMQNSGGGNTANIQQSWDGNINQNLLGLLGG